MCLSKILQNIGTLPSGKQLLIYGAEYYFDCHALCYLVSILKFFCWWFVRCKSLKPGGYHLMTATFVRAGIPHRCTYNIQDGKEKEIKEEEE